MTGAISHIGDLIAIRARFRHHLVQQIADGVYHLQILLLIVATDVVGLPNQAGGHHLVECACVVFHIEPITDLVTLAVYRQRFAIQGVEDHQRDQLLGEVVRAVVVGAVGDDSRQAVSTAPGAHQMVTGGLGGRIGAAGGIRGGFGKERQWLIGSHFIRMGQVTIYLVSGDMVEAEGRLAYLVQTVPVSASRFQQHIGANDIGLDKVSRACDGAINMALGSQVHHSVRLMLGKHPIQLGAIADIHLLKHITIACRYIGQGFQIASISEFIEIDNGILGITDDMAHHGRADKACATGNENFHRYVISCEELIWMRLRAEPEIKNCSQGSLNITRMCIGESYLIKLAKNAMATAPGLQPPVCCF